MDKLRGLGGALRVGAVIAAVTAYARVSDAVSTATAQLRLASRNQSDLNRLQRESYAIAQRNGVAWGATATLAAKATKAARSMGLEMDRAMELGTNAAAAISAGIRVSGTNSAAAAAGVFQLSQALASGVLRGDELNSVMENIPAVGDAIARAMGRSAGELRNMGKEGELTSKAVIEALEKARPELERLADLIPLTFGAAFEKVKNAGARLLSSMDQEGVGFGGALIASMNLLSKTLDFLANNADTVSNVIIGLLVAAAVKAAASSSAAAAAAVAQAKANHQVATSAVAAAAAQHRQAMASLAVAQAMNAQGVATKSQVANSAAAVGASAANLGKARQAATATGAAMATAASRASLIGRAVTAAATVARAALAMIGGPIGLVIAGLAGVVLWAGKAALGFRPIKDEAGTVADYIAVAFDDASKWVGEKAKEMWQWMKTAMEDIRAAVRPVTVFIIDAFLAVARSVAGAVAGIVEVWKAGVRNISALLAGLAKDVASSMSGDFTIANTTAALQNGTNAGAAFSAGWRKGTGALGDVTGESIVAGAEKFMESIPGRIENWARNSGLRERANQRAIDRARMANTGGDQGPGNGVVGSSEEEKKKEREQNKRTFQEILDEAKEQAQLAALTTNEAEKQSAIFQAQRDLKRDLTDGEKEQLAAAIQLKQNNAANLALLQQTESVQDEITRMRAQAAAEDARLSGNYALAASLEAELRVQELLNAAKREGVTLDAQKVAAYREAVLLAAKESELIRLQQEARRALQQIADNAREAIQDAVADGIYAALSGDIKGIKGFFKTIGNILKRQMAETITYNLFAQGQQARVNQLRVTQEAVAITAPAAHAIAVATNNITAAMGGQVAPLQQSTQQFVGVLQGAVDPLGSAISAIINTLGRLIGLGGGKEGLLGQALGPGGPLAKLSTSISRFLGINVTDEDRRRAAAAGQPTPTALSKLMGKVGTGMMYGQLGGMVPGLFGARTSSLGASLGGIAGSFIGGPIGAAIGGAIGSAIGGLFKKTKQGGITITAEGAGSSFGNSGSMREAASEAGNTIVERLRKAAEALGGSVGSFGSITIGQRKDTWRVNTGGSSLKHSKGAVDFGDDVQAALDYAFQEAIRRGALKGLSAGVEQALRSGAATVEEAVNFQQISKRIKRQALSLVDPVAAAVQEVDDEFGELLKQYKKFGESTVELEAVWLDTRKKAIEEALDSQLGVVRDFLSELRGGALGGASLTDRVSEQDRLFSALEKAQAEGKTLDFDELNSVGRALIEASRELEGATPAFYDQVDRVMAVLEKAITDAENTSNVELLNPPIDTAPLVDGLEGVREAINDNFEKLLDAMNGQSQAIVRGNTNLETAVRGVARGGGGGTRGHGFMVQEY